ncbi:MAG: caspase family protein [Bacteroidales bacterium]|nr:MAG: caspase family protein [Bacteroidales bacterium]
MKIKTSIYAGSFLFLAGIRVCSPEIMFGQEQNIETVIQTGHYASVTAVAYSPDGKFAATGSNDKTIKLWDALTGREIRTYHGNNGESRHLTFSLNGTLIASVDQDFSLKIWKVATSELIRTIVIPEDDILCATFTPDDNILTGSEENHAVLWDINTGKEIRRFNPLPRDIPMQKNFRYPSARSAEISPDGTLLLTGSNDRTVILFDFHSGEELMKFKGDRGSCTSCLISASFSFDGEQFVTLYDSVHVWKVETGERIVVMDGRSNRDGAAVFSDNDEYIISSYYRNANIYNARTGKLVTNIEGHPRDINDLKISPAGNYLLTGSADRTARIWEIPSGKEVLSLKGFLNDVDEAVLSDGYMYWIAFINEVRLSPDGQYIAIGKAGNNAKLMDFSTGRVIQTYRGHEAMVISLDFSSDGKYLATGSVDGTARIWNVLTGELLYTLPDRTSDIPVFTVAFSTDGKSLATGSWDGRTRIWDLETGKLVQSIPSLTPYAVRFTQNGLYVVSAVLPTRENPKKLRLFEIDTGEEIREFVGHTQIVTSIRMSPDGKYMLSGSFDGMVKLWDIATGLQVQKFRGHSARIHSVNFDSSGKYIITGSDDNTAKLWNAETGRIIRTFTGHHGTVSSVQISPDGKFLITGSHDGSIKTWDIETGNELLTYIFIGESDWLVKTKEGFFDASDGARNSIFFVKGTQTYNIDQFFEEFYRPGLLQEVYRTRGVIEKELNLLNKLEESPPPSVTIITPKTGSEVENSDVKIFVKITNQGGGINEARLTHNGKSLPVDNSGLGKAGRAGQSVLKNYSVSLIPGDNTIMLSAFSNGRIESKSEEIILHYKGLVRTATCYVIAIGINKYENPQLELNYARADARAFAKLVQERAQKLFREIKLIELYDKEATRENILAELDRLAQQIKPEDVFFFYYAGHGSMVDNKFFFIPSESVSLYQLDKLIKGSIYAGDMQEKFKNIKALKQLVVLDACQSGGSTELLAQRGAMEEKALAQMSRSSGVHVLAAAGSEQFATEVGSLGHGLFTHVILEALKGEADGAPRDGKVTIYELKSFLDDQVPVLSKVYKGQAQYPYTFSRGHDFPVVIE